ncbi:PDZ domain [Popillia japonica]|uniref:PDZ domain n=1 Tax=Popillia japonica TaxID=7064 RepID=A0AAW1LTG6_POPJA
MLKFCSPYGKRREYSVNPGSKAAAKGVREGDIITSINGENTRDKTNVEAHSLLKSAGNTLRLGLNQLGLNQDCSGGSPKKRQYNTNNRGALQEETRSETIKRSNISSTTYIVSSSTTTTTSTNTTKKNQSDIEPRSIHTSDITELNGFRINGEYSSSSSPIQRRCSGC